MKTSRSHLNLVCANRGQQQKGVVLNRQEDKSPRREPAIVSVPILTVHPGESPRLNGEDKAHIARLAETEGPLPPILIDRRSMRVIDGMHRLMAASLQGKETIEAIFFDGTDADIFLRAVEENVTHGLPLSQADRRSAAARIIATHPQMSDRAIGRSAGLAAKTVAAIRRRSTESIPQLKSRIGQDGKVRPLDSGEGRRRAAEVLTERPEASLRDVARVAGISPATVRDVRLRLERGEPPAPAKTASQSNGTAQEPSNTVTAQRPQRISQPPSPAAVVERLLRDPSLRNSERGRGMLRLLHLNATSTDQLAGMAETLPPHCVATVAQLARLYSQMWQSFASELNGRARVIDPRAAGMLTADHRRRRPTACHHYQHARPS